MSTSTSAVTPMGEARDEAGLAPEVAALVALSAAVAVGNPDRVATALAEARDAASAEWIEEALLQSYLFVGFPAALNALVRWREQEGRASKAEGADPARWASRGEGVCRTVYGSAYDELRANVARLHPDLDLWMIHEGYGKVLGRPGLPLPVRELCIVGLLVPQEAPRQLHSHLRGALAAGATEPEVSGALEAAVAVMGGAEAPLVAHRVDEAREVWNTVRERHRSRIRRDADSSEEK